MIDYSYAFSNKIVPLHQENGSITILSKYEPSDKIKNELQKHTSIRIVDPAEKMLETILHTKEKKEYAKENSNNDR